LQDFAWISVHGLLLGQQRHQGVDAHRDPDLGLDRVGRRAEEGFDPKVLLDPLEEQFHLPAGFVQPSDRQRVEREAIGQQHQTLAGVRVGVADAAQAIGVVLGRLDAAQRDGLVAAQAGRLVDLS